MFPEVIFTKDFFHGTIGQDFHANCYEGLLLFLRLGVATFFVFVRFVCLNFMRFRFLDLSFSFEMKTNER